MAATAPENMSLTVSPHDLPGLAQPVADLGRFVRTSNGELHIRGREDEASRINSAMSEPAAVVHVGDNQDTLRAEGRPAAVIAPQVAQAADTPRVTISSRRGPPTGHSYPVRVALPPG